jgi:hypothetical protein
VIIVDGFGSPADDGLNAGDFEVETSLTECDASELCIDEVGCATLEQESNDTPAEAQRLSRSEFIAADLGSDSDVDWYVMSMNAGDFVVFDADDVCLTDVVIFVYSDPPPDPLPAETVCDDQNPGPALACADGEPCEELAFTAPADGDYYIRIVGYEGTQSGDYVLEADVD